jgi:hypothetical protein
MALLEYRIHANYSAGAGWRWEVATDRDMIARGIAVTHAQARKVWAPIPGLEGAHFAYPCCQPEA